MYIKGNCGLVGKLRCGKRSTLPSAQMKNAAASVQLPEVSRQNRSFRVCVYTSGAQSVAPVAAAAQRAMGCYIRAPTAIKPVILLVLGSLSDGERLPFLVFLPEAIEYL